MESPTFLAAPWLAPLHCCYNTSLLSSIKLNLKIKIFFKIRTIFLFSRPCENPPVSLVSVIRLVSITLGVFQQFSPLPSRQSLVQEEGNHLGNS